jgi:hypothetical protein
MMVMMTTVTMTNDDVAPALIMLLKWRFCHL